MRSWAAAGERWPLTLVPVGDTPAFVEALSRVLGDAALRARLAEGARRMRDRLPTWEQTSGRIADALDSLVTHGEIDSVVTQG